jgi:hypothetical protein
MINAVVMANGSKSQDHGSTSADTSPGASTLCQSISLVRNEELPSTS